MDVQQRLYTYMYSKDDVRSPFVKPPWMGLVHVIVSANVPGTKDDGNEEKDG
jgi:hypothetical protein